MPNVALRGAASGIDPSSSTTARRSERTDDPVDRVADRAETARMIAEYVVTRDPELKERIVSAHQWLVVLCARRMQRRREPLEDLIQVCNVGLLEAMERFDPSFGVAFRSYASATLDGVLRHHYRTAWRLRTPRRIQELNLRVSRAIDMISGDLQRSPTLAEVAAFTDATIAEVTQAMDAGANFWPLSLSEGGDAEVSGSVEAVQHADQFEQVEHRVDVVALLALLPGPKRRIMYMSYFEDLTQREIARVLGISEVSVSRTMRAALLLLREAGAAGPLTAAEVDAHRSAPAAGP